MNINEYSEHLRIAGKKVLAGSEETLWVSPRPFVMQRRPYFALHLPSSEEIQAVFSESHAAFLSFTTSSPEFSNLLTSKPAPGVTWGVPSSLYICSDPEYSQEKLSQSARSHIRRSLNEFEIRFVAPAEVLNLGRKAYCDTRARFGLSPGTPQAFEATFCPAQSFRRYLGAFKDQQLAAFLVITEVDDWASIGSGYAVTELLSLRPNNGLLFRVLQHYLVEKKYRLVDHGLSNFPFSAKMETLHRFKEKMGFKAHPVHRGFVMDSLLRPLVNRLSWRLANGLQKLSPRNPWFERMELVLRMALRTESSTRV
jgi:hypothetical protein